MHCEKYFYYFRDGRHRNEYHNDEKEAEYTFMYLTQHMFMIQSFAMMYFISF